jgi:hypothetical protein
LVNQDREGVGLLACGAARAPDDEPSARADLGLKHRQKLLPKPPELAVFSKKIRLVRRQQVHGLVPFVERSGTEAEVMVVFGEAREIENDEPFSETSLQRKARLATELYACARRE